MPPSITQNQYIGLPIRDIKVLMRSYKNDTEMLPLLEAALKAAQPPFKPGRLSGENLLDLAQTFASSLEQLQQVEGAPTSARANAIAGLRRGQALIEKFRVPKDGETPPATA
jgi:hypothetical protein